MTLVEKLHEEVVAESEDYKAVRYLWRSDRGSDPLKNRVVVYRVKEWAPFGITLWKSEAKVTENTGYRTRFTDAEAIAFGCRKVASFQEQLDKYG